MSPVLQEVHKGAGTVAEAVDEGGGSPAVTALCAGASKEQVVHVGAFPGSLLKWVLSAWTGFWETEKARGKVRMGIVVQSVRPTPSLKFQKLK